MPGFDLFLFTEFRLVIVIIRFDLLNRHSIFIRHERRREIDKFQRNLRRNGKQFFSFLINGFRFGIAHILLIRLEGEEDIIHRAPFPLERKHFLRDVLIAENAGSHNFLEFLRQQIQTQIIFKNCGTLSKSF